MRSNVKLKSNIYVNKTKKGLGDKDFAQHIMDYGLLRKGYGKDYRTPLQEAIVTNHCSLDKGMTSMSWGIPVGGDSLRCRCEKTDCEKYGECSRLPEFDLIEREVEKEEPPYEEYDDLSELIGATFSTSPRAPVQEVEGPAPTPELVREEDRTEADTAAWIGDEKATVSEVAPVIGELIPTWGKEDLIGPASAPQDDDDEELEENEEGATAADAPVQEASSAQSSGILASFEKVEDSHLIVKAGIHDRIWVNAGPGTGKTHTVVERLKFLLERGDLDGSILVFCYTRNAVHLIKSRLEEAMEEPLSQWIEEGALDIRTMDSFATFMLDDELDSRWNYGNYDQRIEQFIERLKPKDLEEIDYLIVDELQDIVGVRAYMLKTMLEKLRSNHGVLLLGDYCQAIYDWSLRDRSPGKYADWSSEKLKGWLDGWLRSSEHRRFELTKNYRQQRPGEKERGDRFRKSLLEDDKARQAETLEACKAKTITCEGGKDLEDLPKSLKRGLGEESCLVLCRTNGDAALVSDSLYQQDVPHRLLQHSQYLSFAPWIGKIFSESDGDMMSRPDFLAKAQEKEIEDAEAKWYELRRLDKDERSRMLHIRDVLKALSRAKERKKREDIPSICCDPQDVPVIVSTIHRAKGSEADHVYWLDPPLSGRRTKGGEEHRVAYVAMTRCKKTLRRINGFSSMRLKRLESERWIKKGKSRYPRKDYCAGIAMAPDDVDILSFADAERQKIIASLQLGDELELRPHPHEDRYDIQLPGGGDVVGQTSESFMEALEAGYQATNRNRNCPVCITGVYVSALTTIIAPEANVGRPYNKSGCWLGLELGGFAHIRWHDGY